MQTLLQEPYAQIFLDEKEPFIEIRIKRGISKYDYQFTYKHALAAAKTHNISKFLINEGFSATEQLTLRTWFATQYLPTFFTKMGLSVQMAVVRSQNKFTSMSGKLVEIAQNKLQAKFSLAFFEDDEEAVAWLSTQQDAKA